MRLTIGVSAAEVRKLPSLFLLMLTACAETEGEGLSGETVATLEDFPAELDLALELVEAVNQLRQARVSMDGRPVTNLHKLWSALSCYRESLAEADPRVYCLRQAARVGEAGGCPDHTCASPCPFICARCFQDVGDRGETSRADRLRMIAVDAMVDWCPHLPLFCLGEMEGRQRG
jgi:hypothetical protein